MRAPGQSGQSVPGACRGVVPHPAGRGPADRGSHRDHRRHKWESEDEQRHCCSRTPSPGDKLGSQWTTFITSRGGDGQPWWEDGAGGSGEGCQFDEEYFEPGDVRVDNGLSLEAVRQPTEGECNGLGHVFAWKSGVVTTYGHFEFDGGYVDVDMEAPAGAGCGPPSGCCPAQAVAAPRTISKSTSKRAGSSAPAPVRADLRLAPP